jgi:hypothetical protein
MTDWSRRTLKQLMGCQRKGREAFLRGEPADSCPYAVAPWSTSSGAKNLTRRRREYWQYGWQHAAEEAQEKHVKHVDGPPSADSGD